MSSVLFPKVARSRCFYSVLFVATTSSREAQQFSPHALLMTVKDSLMLYGRPFDAVYRATASSSLGRSAVPAFDMQSRKGASWVGHEVMMADLALGPTYAGASAPVSTSSSVRLSTSMRAICSAVGPTCAVAGARLLAATTVTVKMTRSIGSNHEEKNTAAVCRRDLPRLRMCDLANNAVCF
jgi:hypothetical protein